MISLLVAIFGKQLHIPTYVRVGLLALGIGILIYRVRGLLTKKSPEPEIEIKVQPASPVVEVKQPPPQLGLLKYTYGY